MDLCKIYDRHSLHTALEMFYNCNNSPVSDSRSWPGRLNKHASECSSRFKFVSTLL